MKYKTLHLDSGYRARVRPVPALAADGSHSDPDLWMPKAPKIKVKTAAGEEWVDAPANSPEYQEYLRKIEEVSHLRERSDRDFHYDYGVVSWAIDVEGDIPESEWMSEPPDNWVPDERLVQRLETDDRRLLFIMSELILTLDDINKFNYAAYNIDMTPVTEGEVGAAEGSFPGDVEEAASE